MSHHLVLGLNARDLIIKLLNSGLNVDQKKPSYHSREVHL